MNALALTKFAAEETTGIGALGLDWKVMLLQAGAFVIFFFLFKKYALSKVVKILDDRHQTISGSLKTAGAIEKRAKRTVREAEEIISKARKDADDVVAKAHEEAGEIIKEAENKARRKQEKMVAEAEAKIHADVNRAKEELKGELLGLVATATENVLQEKIDASKDEQLIRKSLAEARK